MDPDTCWKEICELLLASHFHTYEDEFLDEDDLVDEREELVERLRDLATWIERGGFLPRV